MSGSSDPFAEKPTSPAGADQELFATIARERRERRRVWWIGGAVAVVLLVWLAIPRAQLALRPELVGALVAVEPLAASATAGVPLSTPGVATVGTVGLTSGTAFRLHAVLVAGLGEDRVYYTEAERLVVDGREVPPDRVRRWPGPEVVRALWFTVEGYRPLITLPAASSRAMAESAVGAQPPTGLRFAEFFRPEWGRSWTVAGELTPRNDDHLASRPGYGGQPFGTQRFQVRLELAHREADALPFRRLASPGPDQVSGESGESPTTVIATLAPPLDVASAVWGLSTVQPPQAAPSELLAELAALTRRRLAIYPLALFSELLERRNSSFDQIHWLAQPLDGTAVAPNVGSLLRVGARVVVFFADEGSPGQLDGADRCLDYEDGPRALTLDQVFVGDGLVEVEVAKI